jgi:HNH endonuclease
VSHYAPIPGWPGYSIDIYGSILGKRGWVLTPSCDKRTGYARVCLRRDGRNHTVKVHQLVLLTFIGPCPSGKEPRHLNGRPADNRLANLRYGTKSQNTLDKVAHGTHPMARKTQCKRGHQFTPENTYLRPGGGRRCRRCQADIMARRRRAA